MTESRLSLDPNDEIDLAQYIANARKEAGSAGASLQFDIARQPGLTWINRLKRSWRRHQRRWAVRRSIKLRMLMTLNGSEFIDKVYVKLFNRHADPNGLAIYRAWLNGTVASRIKVINSLRNSPEGRVHRADSRWLGLSIWWRARSLYGLRRDEMMLGSDAEFVERAYKVLLGREPDPGGYALRIAQAQAGPRGRARALIELCASEEGRPLQVSIRGLAFPIFWRRHYRGALSFARRTAAAALSGPRIVRALPNLDNVAFIEMAFAVLLGRPAVSDELVTCTQALTGPRASRIKLLQSLRRSEEGRTRTLCALSVGWALWWNKQSLYDIRLGDMLLLDDVSFVTNAYRLLLAREPGPADRASRLAQAQQGRGGRVHVLAALCGSEEGRALNATVRGLKFAVFKEKLYHGIARDLAPHTEIVREASRSGARAERRAPNQKI